MKILPFRTVENVVESEVVTFTNITEMRRMQEQLKKFMIAVDQSPNIFMIIDTSGNVSYVNRSYGVITGFQRDSARKKKPQFFTHMGPKERKLVWDTLKSGDIWQGQVKFGSTDKEKLPNNASIFPLRSAAGDITDYVVICTDLKSCDCVIKGQ